MGNKLLDMFSNDQKWKSSQGHSFVPPCAKLSLAITLAVVRWGGAMRAHLPAVGVVGEPGEVHQGREHALVGEDGSWEGLLYFYFPASSYYTPPYCT